jgi:hypothetical protein
MMLVACVAAAQGTPAKAADPNEDVIPQEQQAPAANGADPTNPPSPPAVSSLLPSEFRQKALSWDASKHHATLGQEHKELSRDEFFSAIDRPDLLQKSTSLSRRRLIFGSAAVVTAIAGITSGALVLGTNNDLNAPACVQNPVAFNACSDSHHSTAILGTSLIVAGVLGASLFATFAYWASPEVVDDDEAQRLISRYNGDLLKKLRLNALFLPNGGAFGLSGNF